MLARSLAVAAAAHSRGNDLQTGWNARLDVRVVAGQTYNALAAADAAIVSSGTATVEAALLNVPMVVVYRVTPLTALLAKPLVRTSYFSMVNLIAERTRCSSKTDSKRTTRIKVAEGSAL